MVKDLSYLSIATVLDTWELARQRHGNKEVGKKILLQLFKMEPRTKQVFGLDTNDALLEDGGNNQLMKAVVSHGEHMVHMIDGVVALLGPDTDTIEEILGQLGERHVKYGIERHYFQLLGSSICQALSSMLEDEWTDEVDDAWEDVFEEFTSAITSTM
jgi:hemoglobin-like flavoprotein